MVKFHCQQCLLKALARPGVLDEADAVLLALWSNKHRASSEVKRLAQAHAAELGEKISEMQAVQRTLLELSRHCRGNQRPDCPILDDLAG